MRVGMLTSWEERCGIAAYSRHLVAALRAQVEVEVVPTSFNRCPAHVYRSMGQALSGSDVSHVQHSYAFFGGMGRLAGAWRSVLGAVRTPLLVTVHELDNRPTRGWPFGLEEAYKRLVNRRTFRHPAVGHLLVHAEALADALRELGVPDDRITCTPMPVPPAPDRTPEGAGLRRELGLEGRRVLVVPGFLSRRKGYDVALEALGLLPEEFVLVAAGGEHAADTTGTERLLREQAAARGVADRFRVTGYLSEERLEDALAMADLILAPFREMSASASVGLALGRGKAVVASDLPENRRLHCVRLFPSGDAAALAQAVREAIQPEARAALERRAQSYAAEHSFASLAARTVELYRALGARRARRD